MKRLLLGLMGSTAVLLLVAVVVLFSTDYGRHLRVVAAESILSSQHRSYAQYTFLPQEELDRILASINQPKYVNSLEVPEEAAYEHVFEVPSFTSLDHIIYSADDVEQREQETAARLDQLKSLKNKRLQLEKENEDLTVTVTTVERRFSDHYFKGQILTISNPYNVKLASSGGSQGAHFGEQLNVIAKREGAVAAINASGFLDANGQGNGGTPIGIVIQDGKYVSSSRGKNHPDYVAGLTKGGILVTGYYKPTDLLDFGVEYAAGFKPQLIVNGQKMISEGNGGWGYGPRTALAQKKDGTLIFLVIDGRQPHSIGASIKDVQDLLAEYGAYNAMAMDGGSSSLMYFNRQLITTPSSVGHIPRFIPNAWVVVPEPGQPVTLIRDGKTIQ